MGKASRLGFLRWTTLYVAIAAVTACHSDGDSAMAATDPQAGTAASTPVVQPPPAQDNAPQNQDQGGQPTADELYQLVSPIALFPDKLVAQTLAASTYPDQVSSANSWMAEHNGEKPDALQDEASQQPWDPSVKSLTAFPAVLDQLARNIDWTTSLGQAYANDPNDVLNAIQVMRQRAQAKGNLKSTPQQKVEVVDSSSYQPPQYADDGTVYEESSTTIIGPPPQTIVIEPAEEDVVYVPSYDPAVVYGETDYVYPGYAWRPAPRFTTGEIIATGAIAFTAGVLIASAFDHHHDRRDYGWHAWNVNWGARHGGPGPGGGYRGPRPAVVYNNHTYVTRRTVINNHVNNVTINRNSNNTIDNRGRQDHNGQANRFAPQAGARPGLPNAGANNPHVVPATGHRPGAPNGHPDFAHMQRPNFTSQMIQQHAQPADRGRPGTAPAAGRPGRPNVAQGHAPPPIGPANPIHNTMQDSHRDRSFGQPANVAGQQPHTPGNGIAPTPHASPQQRFTDRPQPQPRHVDPTPHAQPGSQGLQPRAEPARHQAARPNIAAPSRTSFEQHQAPRANVQQPRVEQHAAPRPQQQRHEAPRSNGGHPPPHNDKKKDNH
ncbi:DUF3300 domain-containing protein [Pinirhizobacter sp.]|uniref:DUF3300 domain-containing protein n=1 Tax=Pinirhizobacter sp. TaxID=2950432 RepID=UPI002F418209